MDAVTLGCCSWLMVVVPGYAAAPGVKLPAQLPITKLAPARLFPGQCLLHYPVSTQSKVCQQLVDQALGYHYSYVWMEAARSFETATLHDPNCAFAWWGLSRALAQWGRGDANSALKKAHELLSHANLREQKLITAAMQERGLLPGVGDGEARRRAARQTLDELLALHPDDEEAWFYRGQIAADNRLFGGTAAAVPYYKGLLHLNPLHPGANHELVHFYENFGRPALGWEYSENYIKSSPGIPHAWHMQSHLSTRLGRWTKATAVSLKAIEVERAYHRNQNVKPTDDHQFAHHLETLLRCLIHDGRFAEARAIRDECDQHGFKNQQLWFRLALEERDFAAAAKIADELRRNDKLTAAYLTALIHLTQHDADAAQPHVDILEEAYRTRRADRTLRHRLWETRGLLLCQTGGGSAGLALLEKVVKDTMNDYGHHAWGGGAYYMETWGLAALGCGHWEIAELAFLEALAHDKGSVRGALGLQHACERLGRTSEAQRYAKMAEQFWRKADPAAFASVAQAIRALANSTGTATTAGLN